MSGQPTNFDFATIVPIENGAPLVPPYSIIELGDKLQLRSYFHCSGDDAVVRKNVKDILTGGTVTVKYFFQDLQGTGSAISPVTGPAIAQLTPSEIEERFKPSGDLAKSGLDQTDDYYFSDNTDDIALMPGGGGEVTGTWRVLTVLHGDSGTGDHVTAFDDSLIVQVV